MAAHALLSASSAKRWLSCTPSARLEENFENRTSKYAEEGTLAHTYAELLIKQRYYGDHGGVSIAELESMEVDQEMGEAIGEHCNYVLERFAAAGKNAVLMTEQKLCYDNWVQEGFGTGDVVIFSEEHSYIEVIDLKYGKGVKVDAEGNHQLRLYALGCIQEYGLLYDFEKVISTISQPRLDWRSSETIKVSDLLEWGEYVKSRAKLAYLGEGEFCAGDHCRFCRAGGACRHRAKQSAIDDFAEKEPPLLTHAEMAAALDKLEPYKAWMSALEKHAFNEAVAGNEIPGYKIVRKNTKRRFDDEKALQKELEALGFPRHHLINEKLKSATDLKKVFTKDEFKRLVEPHQYQPEGEPTLAPIDDKRPVCNPAAEDFKEVVDSEELLC